MGNESKSRGPLRSLLANDPEMADLAELFVSELPERVEQIRKAESEREWQRLKTLSHQLRGSAGGYGFPTIGAAAGHLEEVLRSVSCAPSAEADLSQVHQQVVELMELCRRAMMPMK